MKERYLVYSRLGWTLGSVTAADHTEACVLAWEKFGVFGATIVKADDAPEKVDALKENEKPYYLG
jgi:hypothetical protein